MSTAVRNDRALLRAAHPLGFPLLNLLIGDAPARRVPGLGVLVADPRLVRWVLTDPSFRKDGPGSSGALWAGVLGHRTLIGLDGAAHRALRRPLNGLFTPQAAETACGVMGPVMQRTVTRLTAALPVDVVELTRAAAGAVISRLIGLDATAVSRSPGWDATSLADAGSEVLGMVRLGTRRLSARQRARVKELMAPARTAALAAYDRAARGDVPDSVIGRLATVGITREQAPALAVVLLLTGTETMISAVPRLVALLVDSGRLGGLANHPDTDRRLLSAIVDEGIRELTPSPAMLRRATRPDTLGPAQVYPGDRVLIATWWATRLPGGFDPGRDCPAGVRGLAFGAGAHRCLGAALAAEQARTVVAALLDVERAAGPLRIVDRVAAQRVFVPAYRRLVLCADPRRVAP